MIVFLGPAPQNCTNTGIYQRVVGIDSYFEKECRIYIKFSEDPIEFNYNSQTIGDTQLITLVVSSKRKLHREIIYDFLNAASLIYAHSIFFIEPILEFLKLPQIKCKFITDLHGLVPEEALLSGDPNNANKYSQIEEAAFENSACLIVVTQKMEKHFRKKYRTIDFRSVLIPIFLKNPFYTEPVPLEKYELPVVIYAGGMERWQNIEKMLDAAIQTADRFRYRFFSYCRNEFLRELRNRKLLKRVVFGSLANEKAMREQLRSAHFGFVLRSDVIVNQVACPTKLIEYLHAGVIPIVLSQDIGDFEELGYQYLTLDLFLNGKLPTKDQRKKMIETNHRLARKLRESISNSFKKIMEVQVSPKLNSQELVEKLLLRDGDVIYAENQLAIAQKGIRFGLRKRARQLIEKLSHNGN